MVSIREIYYDFINKHSIAFFMQLKKTQNIITPKIAWVFGH